MDQTVYGTAKRHFKAYIQQHVPTVSKLVEVYQQSYAKTECSQGTWNTHVASALTKPSRNGTQS